MTDLRANQRSFVALMKKSEEHLRYGFRVLTKREDRKDFFDTLVTEGFFAPENNPKPIGGDKPDTVRVPFWPALDYLTACAKQSGERDDQDLGAKIIVIVRAVTMAGIRDNYHTARHFAEIVGLLPLSTTTVEDMDLARLWLGVPFNPGGVALSLDRGALRRLIESEEPSAWQKAVRLLLHCTELRWKKRPGESDFRNPEPIVDDYWLEEILSHHAVPLSRRVAREVVDVLESRLIEVFAEGGRAEWSYIARPAVEDHAQNHSWKCPENTFVQALRDVVLTWVDSGDQRVREYIAGLVRSDKEILRRLGIHVLDERWEQLGGLYSTVVGPELFVFGHLHELYRLLQRHFGAFTPEQQAKTLEEIKNIQPPGGGDAGDAKELQARWLSALRDSSSAEAKASLAALEQEGIAAPLRADFVVYGETSVGPGPSPYQPDELMVLAREGRLVEAVNRFAPEGNWRSPTIEGLMEALEQGVGIAPEVMLEALKSFNEAAPQYQQAIIHGFTKVWRGDLPNRVEWNSVWPHVVGATSKWLAEYDRSAESVGAYRKDWTLSAFAELLREGTRSDDRAYSSELLPQTWALIQGFLEKAEPTAEPDVRDPMFQAINSARGKVVEAMLSHALRVCRIADRESQKHVDAWKSIEPQFDSELAKCLGTNFEFSTLLGAYLAQVDYMSDDWTRTNIRNIFPEGYVSNFECAIGGLAYCSASKPIYVMLRDAGILDAAIRREPQERQVRRHLVDRIVLGYLWDEETIDGPRLSALFESGHGEDLRTAAWFLWSARDQKLSDAQRLKVVDFWERIAGWSERGDPGTEEILAVSARLAWAVAEIDARTLPLFMKVAPHVHRDHSQYEFLKELMRLVDAKPAEVGAIVKAVIKGDPYLYDYEDRLRSLILRLAEKGQRPLALECANLVAATPGLDDVFRKLTA